MFAQNSWKSRRLVKFSCVFAHCKHLSGNTNYLSVYLVPKPCQPSNHFEEFGSLPEIGFSVAYPVCTLVDKVVDLSL